MSDNSKYKNNITRKITGQTCTKAIIEETCEDCDYSETIEEGYFYALGHDFELDPSGDQHNEYRCKECGYKYSIGEKSKRIGWNVYYTVDTSRAKASEMKWMEGITLNSATVFQEVAPEARSGYRFTGWYVYTKDGQKVKIEDSRVSGEKGEILTTTWKDQYKTFEPCYEEE